MPNQPKYPITPVRLPPDLKAAAKEKAAVEGKSLSEVIRELLATYTGV
jgi:predicted HicB family RNase H-like nuclease